MQGQPGDDEFLQRRLARAAAVPPDQRSPEVAAFIAASQLPEQVASLLPLLPDGTPALPLHSADTRQRVLLAYLKYFQAYTQCSASPGVLLADAYRVLYAYGSTLGSLAVDKWPRDGSDNTRPAGILAARRMGAVRGLLARPPRRGDSAGSYTGSGTDSGCSSHASKPRASSWASRMGGGSDNSSWGPSSSGAWCGPLQKASCGDICLAGLLLQLTYCYDLPQDKQDLQLAACFKELADFLAAADSFAGLHLSLQRLEEAKHALLPAASPLPSVAWLRCACLQLVLQFTAFSALSLAREKVAGVDVESAMQGVISMLENSMTEALQLEPGSCQAHLVAGSALSQLAVGLPGCAQRGLDCLLRCAELAQQQGSDLHTAMAALNASTLAGQWLFSAVTTGADLGVRLETAEAALAAFSLGKPAVQRCKGLLPGYWVANAAQLYSRCRPIHEHSWAHLRLLQAQSSVPASRQARAARAQLKMQAGAASFATKQLMLRLIPDLPHLKQAAK